MCKKRVILICFLFFIVQNAHSEEATSTARNVTSNVTSSSGKDTRQLVSMPEQTLEIMRQDMLEHLATLSEIIGYLAANNLEAAADVAEKKMGRSSMGKHRGTGMGPSRFMPPAMHSIGRGMHEAASEVATAAKQGDLKGAYTSLQKVTSSCVACHYSYRTR